MKAALGLFLTPGNEQLTTDAKRYPLDAKGTLSLLLNDLTRGDPKPTGLPTNAIKIPLQDLKESLCQLQLILSPAEMEEFGVDPEGLVSVEDENYRVNVSPLSVEVSDEH